MGHSAQTVAQTQVMKIIITAAACLLKKYIKIMLAIILRILDLYKSLSLILVSSSNVTCISLLVTEFIYELNIHHALQNHTLLGFIF